MSIATIGLALFSILYALNLFFSSQDQDDDYFELDLYDSEEQMKLVHRITKKKKSIQDTTYRASLIIGFVVFLLFLFIEKKGGIDIQLNGFFIGNELTVFGILTALVVLCFVVVFLIFKFTEGKIKKMDIDEKNLTLLFYVRSAFLILAQILMLVGISTMFISYY